MSLSEVECKIITEQIERRQKFREEFLKLRTDPHKHASEAGYVFDPAIQKFMSMKVTSYEHFIPNMRTSLFGICAIVIPMLSFGYVVWNDRNNREQAIRKGELVYRDRLFKFTFISMKSCQYELFNANFRTAIVGIVIVIPMLTFGTLVYNIRSQFEEDCRGPIQEAKVIL